MQPDRLLGLELSFVAGIPYCGDRFLQKAALCQHPGVGCGDRPELTDTKVVALGTLRQEMIDLLGDEGHIRMQQLQQLLKEDYSVLISPKIYWLTHCGLRPLQVPAAEIVPDKGI